MKKLFFAVSALAALTLLAPSAGFAQTAYNQLGMYTDEAGTPTASSINVAVNTQFSAFLVLTNPVNEAYVDGNGTPPYQRVMDTVSGFECQIIKPAAGFFALSEAFNGNAINLGTAPDYVVGFAAPLPVTDGSVMLMSFNMLVLDTNPKEFFLGVTSTPAIPGFMAIVDGSIIVDNLQTVWPSSGDFANPVFGINTDVVATETESWGNVKSLFR